MVNNIVFVIDFATDYILTRWDNISDETDWLLCQVVSEICRCRRSCNTTLAMLTVSLPTMVQVLEIKTPRMNIIVTVQDLIPQSHIAVSQNLFCMRSLPYRHLTKVLFCCMVKNLIWFSYFGHENTKLNF